MAGSLYVQALNFQRQLMAQRAQERADKEAKTQAALQQLQSQADQQRQAEEKLAAAMGSSAAWQGQDQPKFGKAWDDPRIGLAGQTAYHQGAADLARQQASWEAMLGRQISGIDRRAGYQTVRDTANREFKVSDREDRQLAANDAREHSQAHRRELLMLRDQLHDENARAENGGARFKFNMAAYLPDFARVEDQLSGQLASPSFSNGASRQLTLGKQQIYRAYAKRATEALLDLVDSGASPYSDEARAAIQPYYDQMDAALRQYEDSEGKLTPFSSAPQGLPQAPMPTQMPPDTPGRGVAPRSAEDAELRSSYDANYSGDASDVED